jgi:hypothetical protein
MVVGRRVRMPVVMRGLGAELHELVVVVLSAGTDHGRAADDHLA